MSTPGPTATATGLDAGRAGNRKHGLVGVNQHARDKEARPRDGVPGGPKAEAKSPTAPEDSDCIPRLKRGYMAALAVRLSSTVS